ncbi:hypothetical protein IQ07DRAFT_589064 [Pyrenochaeta sp. DS3sAY3a]|nr:hypothetical protein IQ07DRAFT_589064 [Pyrenochaeta sp. DS3sAY3a]
MSYFQAGVAWVCQHPYQTALHTVNAALLVTPAAATVPIFNAVGFGAAGPIAGSAASSTMSFFGFVPAGGLYATIQSAAMGGYGAGLAAGATQAGAVVSSAAAWALGRKG